MKRPILQNERVGVLRMALRGRKFWGTFEERVPEVFSVVPSSVAKRPLLPHLTGVFKVIGHSFICFMQLFLIRWGRANRLGAGDDDSWTSTDRRNYPMWLETFICASLCLHQGYICGEIATSALFIHLFSCSRNAKFASTTQPFNKLHNLSISYPGKCKLSCIMHSPSEKYKDIESLRKARTLFWKSPQSFTQEEWCLKTSNLTSTVASGLSWFDWLVSKCAHFWILSKTFEITVWSR